MILNTTNMNNTFSHAIISYVPNEFFTTQKIIIGSEKTVTGQSNTILPTTFFILRNSCQLQFRVWSIYGSYSRAYSTLKEFLALPNVKYSCDMVLYQYKVNSYTYSSSYKCRLYSNNEVYFSRIVPFQIYSSRHGVECIFISDYT